MFVRAVPRFLSEKHGNCCYNSCVFKTRFLINLALMLFATQAFAQDAPAPAPQQPPAQNQNPPIKVNILNVCTPSDPEKQELVSALKKIPEKAKFSADFEVTRGRATISNTDPARYVRLRRELIGDPVFNVVQYSLSADPKDTQEVLVLKTKDPKDLLLISIEDNISAAAATPDTALQTDTPASHIKIERFGKSSIALARCEQADQSAYESIFSDASKVMAAYRKALGLRGMFRNELAWLNASAKTSATADPKKSEAPKKAGKPDPKH